MVAFFKEHPVRAACSAERQLQVEPQRPALLSRPDDTHAAEQRRQLLTRAEAKRRKRCRKRVRVQNKLVKAADNEKKERKLQRKLQQSEVARAQAWERYLEARGNLRVVARLRPVLNQGDEAAAAVLLPDAEFQRQRLELVSRGGAMHQAARRWRKERR